MLFSQPSSASANSPHFRLLFPEIPEDMRLAHSSNLVSSVLLGCPGLHTGSVGKLNTTKFTGGPWTYLSEAGLIPTLIGLLCGHRLNSQLSLTATQLSGSFPGLTSPLHNHNVSLMFFDLHSAFPPASLCPNPHLPTPISRTNKVG